MARRVARRGAESRNMKRRVLYVVIGAVVLATLISIGALASGTKGNTDVAPSASGGLSESAEQLYERGLAAERSGDATQALALMSQVLMKDSAHMGALAAKKRLTSTQAPQVPDPTKPTPSTGGTTTPGVQSDSAYESALADVGTLLPGVPAGYSAGYVGVDPQDLEVPYEPMPATSMSGRVSVAVLAVHDRGTKDAAAAFVSSHKQAFPKDSAEVSIGSLKGLFGTDGRGIAAVAFSRGRFAFEVVLTTAGAPPIELKDEVVRLAGLFPAAK